ncbi:MAG TPA: DUF805 domain-containing protein [Caulobacter sp.]|nr:DUF805 domain-containing protein [Caulobacter sp.]
MDASNLYRFSGRAGRMTFALTQIGVFIASYVFTFLMIVLTGAGDESRTGVTPDAQVWWMLAGAVVYINGAWISLAAAVRRCHDRDLSGWMLLFVMPPILGQLWLILSLVTGPAVDQDGRNRHGRRKPTFAARVPALDPNRALLA